jgi:hypothetical protein
VVHQPFLLYVIVVLLFQFHRQRVVYAVGLHAVGILFHEEQIQFPRPPVALRIEQYRFRIHPQGHVDAGAGPVHACAQPDAVGVHGAQHGVVQRRTP